MAYGLTSSWQRSSRCGTESTCVEVRRADDLIAVRDAKVPSGYVLSFNPGAWTAFVSGVKEGEVDLR